MLHVSVPSRGLSYLNEVGFVLSDEYGVVSVPSRGLSYLNKKLNKYDFKVIGFRPLTGTLLSKHKTR